MMRYSFILTLCGEKQYNLSQGGIMAKHRQKISKATNTVHNRSAPRNPYADHPLMSKGGVHEKPKKTQRSSVRRETEQLVRDWMSIFNL